jgi:hypothetical protein
VSLLDALNPLQPVIDTVGKIIDKVVPDKAQADAAKAALLSQESAQEFQLLYGQLQANIEEARSTNWFVAGWRPAFGWIGVMAILYSYIVLPFAEFFLYVYGSPATIEQFAKLPHLDLTVLWPLITGMLGIAAARSVEKVKDAEGNR